jgi:hypothetical protein
MVFIGTFESPTVVVGAQPSGRLGFTIADFVRELRGKVVAGAGFEPATFGL